MGTKKERFLIQMKINEVEIQVTEKVERVAIEWRRGDKKHLTKDVYELTPENSILSINETFQKLSVFYKDEKKEKYFKKDVNIKVLGFIAGYFRTLGEVNFDIS